MIRISYILLILMTNISFSKLVINELMPSPISPEPEWIELYNYGDSDFVIDTLLIADPSKSVRIINFSLQSNSYCILCNDTSKLKQSREIPKSSVLYQLTMPTLNNTSDYIKISSNKELIDSLYYDMKWDVKGKSFERIDPSINVTETNNLKVSDDSSGATAGRANSTNNNLINENTYFTINEIMYDVSDNNSEYIELYNYSNDTADLKNCKIVDATGKGIHFKTNVYILPKSYFVIFWDTLIFNRFTELKARKNYYYSNEKISLNNDKDIIIITNYKDSLIDSVSYNNNWHNRELKYTTDISLEKIDENMPSYISNSWNSSTNIYGGTPGEKNSYNIIDTTINKIEVVPNPFSISKSGDNFKLKYITPYQSSKINIKIYDTKGFLISYPINNLFLGKSGTINLPIIDNKNNRLIPQPYIILFDATDTESGSIFEQKVLLVIAE